MKSGGNSLSTDSSPNKGDLSSRKENKTSTSSKLANLPAHIFIDVSNIRSCCLRSCDFLINPQKLIAYLHRKYPNLKTVRYYEGIAKDDKRKLAEFKKLEKLGYTVRSLTRKSYVNKPVIKNFECRKCGHQNRIKVLPKNVKLKSNVDVFLTTELLEVAFSTATPTHIILFSCDGDYAEAIKSAVKNPNVFITVIATPPTKNIEKNTVSSRLKQLYRDIPKQYQLTNIANLKDFIS